MTREVIAFLILFIINTILVFLYIFWQRGKENATKISYLAKATIMFCCPVTGFIFVALAYLIFKEVFKEEVDLADVVFSKDRVTTYVHADEERETNVVSMEEALAVTDKESLRTLMLNVVRGDVQNSLSAISLALNSEDTETSHYAASVLQDSLNDFRANVQKIYRDIKDTEKEIQTAEEEKKRELLQSQLEELVILIDYMNPVLLQQVFTEMEQLSLAKQFDEVCEILYKKEPMRMSSHFFEAVALRLLEVKEFNLSEKWCERAVEMYPNTLTTYTCQLKLYFSNGNRDAFFATLDALRASSVVIDNETLEMIRVFS